MTQSSSSSSNRPSGGRRTGGRQAGAQSTGAPQATSDGAGRRCPNCGESNAETNRFCVSCGEQMGDAASEPQRAVQSKPTVDRDQPIEEETGPREPVRSSSSLQSFLNASDSPEELAHGQIVIITARWILVAAGLLLALWNPLDEAGQLQFQIVLLLGLAVANFFLHARVLTGKNLTPAVVYGASAGDIVVITGMIWATGSGFDSTLFVFYFPALLAISVAFRRQVTAIFAAAVVLAYTALSIDGVDDEATILITRLLMLAGVAVCGGVYWNVEGQRRRAAEEAGEALRAQVGTQSAVQPANPS